ncbi:MAG: glycosyltransferase family 39 protein [Ilumatobacteraceae bacterium]
MNEPDPAPLSSDSTIVESERATWISSVRSAAMAFVLSRIMVLVGAAIVAAELRADENKARSQIIFGLTDKVDPHSRDLVLPRSAGRMILDVLTSWDGLWYMRIVRYGYPTFVPAGITYEEPQARLAFFPSYPYGVRWFDRLLPGGDTFAALFLNLILGATFIVLVGLLTRAWFGVRHARTAMILCAIFPGSFVLSFAYSEALLLTLAAATLLALHHERWLLAGFVAALATATRPNGIAVVFACVVAAIIVARRDRSVRPLIAPILAPIGFIGYQLWIDAHADESRVWFRVQGEAWKEGASFGLTAIRRTLETFTQPLTSPTDMITAASFVCTIVLLYVAWRRQRLPLPALAYSAVIVVLMLLPATVTARPRFLFTAFPLFIAAAVWLDDERRRSWWPYVVGTCLSGLVTLTALYGSYAVVP